jgi:hypothetical protein
MSEIEFDNSVPIKIAPVVTDANEKSIRMKAVADIEKKQIIDQEKAKAGISDVESVEFPKELPQIFFHYGAKILSCPLFETDAEENRILAKHLSKILPLKQTWIASLIIVLIILVGKIIQCSAAVRKLLRKEKKSETETEKSTNAKVTETL